MTKALLYELGKSISFGRLPLLGKVLWPMLMASSDEQGRGLAESDVIKWTVCQNVAELTPDNIPDLLHEMANQEMIHLYHDARGRLLYQIIRWWEYQRLQWAQPSVYEAPNEWIDRERYQRGSDQITVNWDKPGGYAVADGPPPTPAPPSPLPSDLPSPLPCGTNQSNANQSNPSQGNGNQGNDESNASKSQNVPAAAALSALLALPDMDENIARGLVDKCPPPFVIAWAQYAGTQKKLANPAGYAVKGIMSGREPPAPREKPPDDRRRYVEGEYAAYIQH